MKCFSKYRKHMLLGIIMVQILTMSIPVYAYEVFSNWNDAENYIYENMINREDKIKFVFKGDKDNFVLNLKSSLKEAYSQDDYLERSWTQIKPEAYNINEGIETTLNIKYLCSKEQENYIDKELMNITDNIINDDMSDFDKVKAINNYIINRYEYDYDLKSVSVYSSLTTSKAVCQGYSMTAYKMFNNAGIENRIVIGTARGISHSWNVVKIDEKWYQIDITNNDSENINKYFLVNDQFLIDNDYIWDRNMYPSCDERYSKIN
ncbi:transglutaminase domain-containing protein [Clostridium butyricum]|uniref:transglutaminase domain-containing protein n=1 Tax=Clostridium butyricum TaxID=1492 RepID=UPI003D11FE7F